MQSSLSVTDLNNQIKTLLETTFLHVSVQGELSRITFHNSGHWYFTIKDENSSMSCVMFRGNNAKLPFKPEEGMAAIVHGSVSVYTPRGSYQINVTKMEPDGQGALALAYEQLKKKLQAKGYFENKKALPSFVKHIAIVTSDTGAALQDMLKVAQKRWPLIKITLLDTVVQGEGCGAGIAKNIKKADALDVDAIVIGRGGGSIEDLWGFNEEVVADAIYASNTPIISAVGHEIDYVISDFVADVRAPTPTAAMEILLPDQAEMLMRLDEFQNQMHGLFSRLLHSKNQELSHLFTLLRSYSFEAKISIFNDQIIHLSQSFHQVFSSLIEQKEYEVKQLKNSLDFSSKQVLQNKSNMLETLRVTFAGSDPSLGLQEGYAQVVKNGKKTALQKLKKDDSIELQAKQAKVFAKVTKVERNDTLF